MGTLTIECDTGKVSDGYHTFDELYDHRCTLFIALMITHSEISWRSQKHADGSRFPGWFIGGMMLPTGDVTYHLPMSMWNMLEYARIETLETAPEWDGHTSQDVLDRLKDWIYTLS